MSALGSRSCFGIACSVALILHSMAVSAAAAAVGCGEVLVRKEWAELYDDQKVHYINAIKCLQSLPERTQHLYPGVRSRYDDYVAAHINTTELYHFSGSFHPWHRMLLRSFESDLRELCNYTGSQPYWDWTLDADLGPGSFVDSPVFRVNTAFGGNGVYVDTSSSNNTNLYPEKIPGKTGGGCINGGPFADMKVNLGPGKSFAYNPRCLARDFVPQLAVLTLNTSVVEWTLSAKTFAEFDVRAQGAGPGVADMTYHGGGHFAIGGDIGDMGNPYSSPADPLFYLHHANIDRLWDKWQRADWPARRDEIAGPDKRFAYPWDFYGPVSYKNITLDHQLDFVELMQGRRHLSVRDVMDTAALCYRYSG